MGERDPNLDRRDFLAAGALAVAGALVPTGCPAPTPKTRTGTPNLLLLLTDDQSFDAVGYASAGRIATPHLDRLASGGTRFDTAYCAAMPCTPSRGCIMSGRHWNHWRRIGKRGEARLRPGEWTWARALRESGYRTALLGKMHFAPMRADHGFEHAEYCEHSFTRVVAPGQEPRDDYEQWLASVGIEDRQEPGLRLWRHDPNRHPISWARDRGIAYLQERAGSDDPYCLLISFRHPHPPFEPAPAFAELYDPARIVVPDDSWGDMQDMPDALRELGSGGYYPRDIHSNAFLRRRFAYYFALVSQIDAAIGDILRHVDLEQTTVLFTSDHGVYRGRRGRVGKQPYVPFDPVARVPLVAAGYGFAGGGRIAAPVSLVDLAPTLLAAAGRELPTELDGRPLQECIRDPLRAAERAVFCWGLSGYNMVRRGPHKYFRSHDHWDQLLFDVASDPGELRNLARQESAKTIVESLARELGGYEGEPEA